MCKLVGSVKLSQTVSLCDGASEQIVRFEMMKTRRQEMKKNKFNNSEIEQFHNTTAIVVEVAASDVKSSRTSWPQGQNFVLGLGFGLEELSSASASSICSRHVLELFILAL